MHQRIVLFMLIAAAAAVQAQTKEVQPFGGRPFGAPPDWVPPPPPAPANATPVAPAPAPVVVTVPQPAAQPNGTNAMGAASAGPGQPIVMPPQPAVAAPAPTATVPGQQPQGTGMPPSPAANMPTATMPAAPPPAQAPTPAQAQPASPTTAPPFGASARAPAAPVAGPVAQQQPVRGLPGDAPRLVVSGAIYSSDASKRMLIVNGQVMREGADLGGGVVLQEVRQDSAVLGYKGSRYTVLF